MSENKVWVKPKHSLSAYTINISRESLVDGILNVVIDKEYSRAPRSLVYAYSMSAEGEEERFNPDSTVSDVLVKCGTTAGDPILVNLPTGTGMSLIPPEGVLGPTYQAHAFLHGLPHKLASMLISPIELQCHRLRE